jgi:hypothetical protein
MRDKTRNSQKLTGPRKLGVMRVSSEFRVLVGLSIVLNTVEKRMPRSASFRPFARRLLTSLAACHNRTPPGLSSPDSTNFPHHPSRRASLAFLATHRPPSHLSPTSSPVEILPTHRQPHLKSPTSPPVANVTSSSEN